MTDQVKQLVDGVSTATGQQAQRLSQVSQAIVHIEKVTQTTAASAEESAAVSERLTSEAEHSLSVVAGLSALVGGSDSEGQPVAVSPLAMRPRKSGATLAGRVAQFVKPARHSTAPVAGDDEQEDLVGTGTYSKF